MAVFVGDKFIADIKKGYTKISKIYKGKDLVYKKYVFSFTDDDGYKKVITRPWGCYKVTLMSISDIGNFKAFYSKGGEAFYDSDEYLGDYMIKDYTVVPLGNVMYLSAGGAYIRDVKYMGGQIE